MQLYLLFCLDLNGMDHPKFCVLKKAIKTCLSVLNWSETKEGLAQHTDSARVYGELVCQEGSTDHFAILVRKVLWFTKAFLKNY